MFQGLERNSSVATGSRLHARARSDAHRSMDDLTMLGQAIKEARAGLSAGGIPIGAAIFTERGRLLGSGHNRRIQDGDPSAHAEVEAFRRTGRQRTYRDKIMVTTLAPCWYCSGLVRQFRFAKVIVGESVNFGGGIEWLRQSGVQVVDVASSECIELLASFIRSHPEDWHEDIGEDSGPDTAAEEGSAPHAASSAKARRT